MKKEISIGIIGGTGSMGAWFKKYFAGAGYDVLVSGRKTETTSADIVEKCDVVILSLPIDVAIEIAGDIGPRLSKDQLLMDFCSLKEAVVKKMLDSTQADVLGTHPLFGPYTDSIKGQNVILCPGRGEERLKWLGNEFAAGGAVVTVVDPEEHDRSMAVVQGLTHFLAICMGRTLQKMNMDEERACPLSTPVFRINHDLIRRLFSQDLDLYRKIINKNRHFNEALEIFLSAVNEGKGFLVSGSDDGGRIYLESIREFFRDSLQNSLEESNRLISALYGEE